MPTANERIKNKGLSGDELKQCILNDVRDMLDKDAMFSKRLLYDRAAYRFKIQLFLQNPGFPEHMNQHSSSDLPKGPATKDEGGRSKLTTPAKLTNDPNTVKKGQQRDRVIDSPNIARIDNNLPLTVTHRDPESGRIVESKVPFEGEASGKDHPELNKVSDKDVSNEEWK